jgi:hypothetical protein
MTLGMVAKLTLDVRGAESGERADDSDPLPKLGVLFPETDDGGRCPVGELTAGIGKCVGGGGNAASDVRDVLER